MNPVTINVMKQVLKQRQRIKCYLKELIQQFYPKMFSTRQ